MNRTTLQTAMLLLLTMTSGCVDAITFLSFGQVFAAAMTGNTVLFGLAVIQVPDLKVIHYIMALGGFVLGNAIAAVLCRRVRASSGWNLTLTCALLGELACLLASSILVASSVRVSPSLLILLFSAAMGIQGVVARRVGMNGITTTVITSTLTGMVESVVWNMLTLPTRPANPNQMVQPRGATTPWTSIWPWLAAIVCYGGGAAICGSVERQALQEAVWLPAAIIAIVIVVSYIGLVDRKSSQLV